MVNIKVLKALKGDCIVLSYGEERTYNILIDGGYGRECYNKLKKQVCNIKQRKEVLDLVILTHIDNDHIDGILRLFSNEDFDDSIVEQFWFNFGDELMNSIGIEGALEKISLYEQSTLISWNQGKSLEELVNEKKIKRESYIKALDSFYLGDAKITILSPNKKILKELVENGIENEKDDVNIACKNDYSKSMRELYEKEFEGNVTISNKSSIAFLFQYNEIKVLFLGDADAQVLVESLKALGYSCDEKLKIDYCKISHHASKHNTTNEFLNMIECKNYILSTNQTASGRPSKECLSRIVLSADERVTFFCNYEIDYEKIFSKEEFIEYGMRFIFMTEEGITVEENL